MFARRNFHVCDYCNATYENKTDLVIHEYFHTDQDVESLESSLNELDSNFTLPEARRSLQNSQQSIRVSEYYEANSDHQRAYEEYKENPHNKEKVPKIRPMSERIDQLVSLASEYPLEKSDQQTREKRRSSDGIEKDNSKKALLERKISTNQKQFLEELHSNLDSSLSDPLSDINSLDILKPSNQVLEISDSNSFHLQNNLSSKIEIVNSDQDSSSKSSSFKENRPPMLNSYSGQSSQLLKSVLNNKITDFSQPRASNLEHLKQIQPPISMPYSGQTSPLLKIVLNNKMANITQDKVSNILPLKQIQHSTPKTDAPSRPSSKRGPIICSIKLSDLEKPPTLKQTENTTSKSGSDSNSPSSQKSAVGNTEIGKNSSSYKPQPIDKIYSSGPACDLKSKKSVSSEDLKKKWKTSFLGNSTGLSNRKQKDPSKPRSSRSNSASDSETSADGNKNNIDFFSSNTSLGL